MDIVNCSPPASLSTQVSRLDWGIRGAADALVFAVSDLLDKLVRASSAPASGTLLQLPSDRAEIMTEVSWRWRLAVAIVDLEFAVQSTNLGASRCVVDACEEVRSLLEDRLPRCPEILPRPQDSVPRSIADCYARATAVCRRLASMIGAAPDESCRDLQSRVGQH